MMEAEASDPGHGVRTNEEIVADLEMSREEKP